MSTKLVSRVVNGVRVVERIPLSPGEAAERNNASAQQRKETLRIQRDQEVIDEALRRIGMALTPFGNIEEVARLIVLAQTGVLVDSVDSAWVETKRLYMKHKELRTAIEGYNLGQLQTFDPTDDALWAP